MPLRFILRSTSAALVSLLLAVSPGFAQGCSEDAMIVFDGSGSMSEMGFNRLDVPRIFEARTAMKEALPSIAQRRRLGLMIYGPGGGETSCSNIALRFTPIADAASRIIAEVEGLEPDGETALTVAVAQASRVLEHEGIVVLVTDGDETCGGMPCQLAAELAATHPALIVHVIGFRVRGAHFNWQDQGDDGYATRDSASRCLADRTGGLYIAAEGVDELAAALYKTLGCQIFGALDHRVRVLQPG